MNVLEARVKTWMVQSVENYFILLSSSADWEGQVRLGLL